MTARILTTDEAMSLQTALNAHGESLVVDGHFGELSRLALIRFQHANGLPETGNPDLVTTSALGIPPITTPEPRKEYPLDTVLANVKSAWLSKLNWTIVAGIIFNAATFFGLNIPSDVKDAIVTAGNAIVLIAAFVIRTWFTTSITTASAKKL